MYRNLRIIRIKCYSTMITAYRICQMRTTRFYYQRQRPYSPTRYKHRTKTLSQNQKLTRNFSPNTTTTAVLQRPANSKFPYTCWQTSPKNSDSFRFYQQNWWYRNLYQRHQTTSRTTWIRNHIVWS